MIEQEWRKFCLACFGNLSNQQQYIDLRRTFYGGASMTYFYVMTKLDPGDEPTEADLQRIRDFHNELVAFNDAVKAGEA